MSNSHARHGVVVPAWDMVAVKATLKPSMGCHRRGQLFNKKSYLYRKLSVTRSVAKGYTAWGTVTTGNKDVFNGIAATRLQILTERKKEEYKEAISLLKRGYSVRNTAKLCFHEPTTARQSKYLSFALA